MRKTLLFVGSVIILIFSAITFIFIPAATPGAQGDALVFGKYGNKKIEYAQGTEFANAVNNYTEMYRNQGANLTDSDYFYIYNYAFNSAVQAIAYKQAIEKAGWKPAEEAVARAMVSYFADENGNYSSKIYNSVAPEDVANLKKELTRGQVWNRYSEDLLGSQVDIGGQKMYGLKAPAAEAEFLAKAGGEKRAFDMAVFNTEDYPDSAVKTFAGENKDLFNKYNVSVITVKESAKAKSVLNKIKNEEITFADAVGEYSDKAYSGSDGLVTSNLEYQIKDILKNADDIEKISALNVDELSDVIETSAGYSIFRCNLAKTAPDLSDKATIAAVRSYIETKESSKIEDYYITSAKGMISNAATKGFKKACDDSEGKYVSVPAFPLNYDNSELFASISSDVKELASASSNENFLKTAFSLKQGEVSEPIVLGSNVIVLKLTTVQTDNVTDTAKKSVTDKIKTIDQSASQSALLTSSKVKNDVSNVFFNKIMKK